MQYIVYCNIMYLIYVTIVNKTNFFNILVIRLIFHEKHSRFFIFQNVFFMIFILIFFPLNLETPVAAYHLTFRFRACFEQGVP